MTHPIDNQYHYGTVYNLDGQIVGFNLSPDVCISLTDEEIERALGAYAKRKHEQDEFFRTVGEIANSINKLVGKTDEQNKEGERMDIKSYWNEEDDENIICPYCGKSYEPSYEDTFIGEEQVDCYTENIHEYVCDKCGKKFTMYGYLGWKYHTETIDGEMTNEEYEKL